MPEPDVTPSSAPRPALVFRTALTSIVAKERSARTRRTDRVQAVASLSDSDLVALVQAFEQLMHGPADVSTMVTRLHATLRTISPAASNGEDGDA